MRLRTFDGGGDIARDGRVAADIKDQVRGAIGSRQPP